MKRIFLLLLFIPTAQANDTELCQKFISEAENYKLAHENKYCLSAANSGSPSAQYQVGMAYGFAGNKEQEEKYYRLSANQGGIAAYLALGHTLKEKDPNEAIYWYERYAKTKTEGYGYAAILLAQLYKNINNQQKSNYWLGVCKQSPYNQNCNLK